MFDAQPVGEESVTASAFRLRKTAEAGPIGKRHSSMELYQLLEECAKLADRCRSGHEQQEMRALVAQTADLGRRRYVERGSDELTLVCRFVFSDLKSDGAQRSNASRYAHALRQARLAGIRSDGLARHLFDEGGINALYLSRPLEAQQVSTKTLYLTESISVPKDRPITLVLQREADNRYRVLSSEVSD